MAIILAALIYALVFGEVFLRLLAPQPLVPRYITGTQWGIRGNIPGAVYRQITPETDATIRINGQGLRADRDYATAKPAGVCRVAMFGDSYFLGYEVNLEDMVASHLEANLLKRGYRAEVLNFSVSGFGTAEMVRSLEANAINYQPDIVVFQWHASDLSDNVRSGLFRINGQGLLEPWRNSYLPAVAINDTLMKIAPYRLLSDHSQLFSAIREKASITIKGLVARWNARSFTAPPVAEDGEEDALPAEGQSSAARLGQLLLTRAMNFSHGHGASWMVFDIPTFSSRKDFKSSLDRLGITPELAPFAVSPVKAFEAAARPDLKLYFEQGHRHLTPEGNAIAAGVLTDAVIANSAPQLARCAVAN